MRPRTLFPQLLVALAACGKPGPEPEPFSPAELYADACAKIVACDCGYSPFAEMDDCIKFVTNVYDSLAERAAEQGLTMDWDCLEDSLGITRYGCGTSPLPTENPQCASCGIIHGERQVGETCSEDWLGETIVYSDCAKGLRCGRDGTCWDPCAPPQSGRPCPAFGCGDDLVCGSDELCRPGVVGEGEDCFYPILCEAGLVCGKPEPASLICVQPQGVGDPCCPDCCDVGLGCNQQTGVCAPLAGIGESCPSIGCVSGAYCSTKDETCHPMPGLGEYCETWGCQPGLGCYNNICLPSDGEPCSDLGCDGDSICGDDGVCHGWPPIVCYID